MEEHRQNSDSIYKERQKTEEMLEENAHDARNTKIMVHWMPADNLNKALNAEGTILRQL